MRLAPLMLPLLLAGTLRASDLPITETPIGRLSLPVVENSLVISPDSAHLAFATRAGTITLADKGIFQNSSGTPITSAPPDPDLPKNIRALVRLSIDDKSTAAFEVLTQVVYSPDSKRLGFAGQKENLWQIVIDNRAVAQDAQSVPLNPIAFSPDSAHAAWAYVKEDHYVVSLDGKTWPPVDASGISPLLFSPDSHHLAAFIRIKTAWTLYIDGQPLAPPQPGASAPAAAGATAAATPLIRLGEFSWRPDSSGLGFYAAFPNTPWQLFFQSLDGAITFTSQPSETFFKAPPAFPPIVAAAPIPATHPAANTPHLAFATANSRNKWTVFTDNDSFPVPSPDPPFDNLLAGSLHYILPVTPADGRPVLIYLAELNKSWRLYQNHQPLPDLTFDAIVTGSFLVSPDRRHYAFAALHSGKTLIIKDGQLLFTTDGAVGTTFAFSPDSQHLACAVENIGRWYACLDGKPGSAPFAGFAPEPIAFSPDSTRIAFTAEAFDKSWHVVIGPDAQYQSKPYERILKDSKVTWQSNRTLTAIAIEKKVATRLEATLPQ